MRRGFAAFILAVATLGGVSSASAQFRIAEDRGGQIGPYLQQFAMVRDSGSRVMIDGTCLSACTLVLGTVPRERICVTPRANLGFHAAWNLVRGRSVYSEEGTRLLWEIYPTQIRNWIRRKGGLKPQMIYLRGKELASMYETCPSTARYADNAGSHTPRTPSADSTLFAATRKPM